MTEKKPNPEQHCRYRPLKIDEDVLYWVKAASMVLGKFAQEWASDVLNQAAAEILKREPLHRKSPPPPKPRGGRKPRKRKPS